MCFIIYNDFCDTTKILKEISAFEKTRKYVKVKRFRNTILKKYNNMVKGYKYISGGNVNLKVEYPNIYNITENVLCGLNCIVRIVKFEKDCIIPPYKLDSFENTNKIRLFMPVSPGGIDIYMGPYTYHLNMGELWYVPVNIYHTIISAGTQKVLYFDYIPCDDIHDLVQYAKAGPELEKDYYIMEDMRTQLLRSKIDHKYYVQYKDHIKKIEAKELSYIYNSCIIQ